MLYQVPAGNYGKFPGRYIKNLTMVVITDVDIPPKLNNDRFKPGHHHELVEKMFFLSIIM
jgi:hypothetical protein